VGFDPNEVKFFEAPIIKDRMTALLGEKYEPTMKLLRTAQEIQQEGALFYVASRYAPTQVQSITDKAGMVWNADTNQMAVVLIKDGVPEIFSEQAASVKGKIDSAKEKIDSAKEKITPKLPAELQRAYDKAQDTKKALDEKQKQLFDTQEIINQSLEGAKSTAIQTSTKAISAQLPEAKAVLPAPSPLEKPVAAAKKLHEKANTTEKTVKAKKEKLTTPTPELNIEEDFEAALKKEAAQD